MVLEVFTVLLLIFCLFVVVAMDTNPPSSTPQATKLILAPLTLEESTPNQRHDDRTIDIQRDQDSSIIDKPVRIVVTSHFIFITDWNT